MLVWAAVVVWLALAAVAVHYLLGQSWDFVISMGVSLLVMQVVIVAIQRRTGRPRR